MLREEDFALKYLYGVDQALDIFVCDGDEEEPDAIVLDVNDLVAYLSKNRYAGDIDIMEVFGGEGGVTKIAIRRRLRTGRNFDIVCNMDLCNPQHATQLHDYVTFHKPLVIVGGPPCSAFSNWSRYNRVHSPETYAKTRAMGVTLARVFARIAELQMRAGRYFLCENPAGSELFQLPEFIKLWTTGQVGSVNFPQCAVGLVLCSNGQHSGPTANRCSSPL